MLLKIWDCIVRISQIVVKIDELLGLVADWFEKEPEDEE